MTVRLAYFLACLVGALLVQRIAYDDMVAQTARYKCRGIVGNAPVLVGVSCR